MENVSVHVLTKTLTKKFTFADLRKKVEILRANTDNKFSFNNRIKISAGKIRIKGLLRSFPNTNSAIL